MHNLKTNISQTQHCHHVPSFRKAIYSKTNLRYQTANHNLWIEGQTIQWSKEEGQTIQWPKEEGQTIQWPNEKGQTIQ